MSHEMYDFVCVLNYNKNESSKPLQKSIAINHFCHLIGKVIARILQYLDVFTLNMYIIWHKWIDNAIPLDIAADIFTDLFRCISQAFA